MPIQHLARGKDAWVFLEHEVFIQLRKRKSSRRRDGFFERTGALKPDGEFLKCFGKLLEIVSGLGREHMKNKSIGAFAEPEMLFDSADRGEILFARVEAS
jgi:hypothetical protein